MKTKEKIIITAKELFIKNGYDNTSIRDISKKADINIALVNYHFKSKDRLFSIVIEEILNDVTPVLYEILNSKSGLNEKIKKYIDTYIDIILKNPKAVSFIINLISISPERLSEIKAVKNLYGSEVFYEQIKSEYEKGNINKIDPRQLFLNIIGMISMPFAIDQIARKRYNFNDDEFIKFVQERKAIIYKTIIKSLYY